MQQSEYDTCISKNLKKPFANIATICNIPDNFNCDTYFKKDKNNDFASEVINKKCSPVSIQDIDYMKEHILGYCNNKKKYVKFYDENGNILTYNKDKSNKGFVEYNEKIFDNYEKAVQVSVKCNK
jgi:hypothetical protein